MKKFTYYHIHDDTSNCNGYADSCTKYTDYIELAKRDGHDAIAFSNHGGIYDWIKKKQSCDKAGLKYIHGVELYMCADLKDNDRGYHIGMYSKNFEGVKELNKLMSLSTSKGNKKDNSDRHYYFNPRLSLEEVMNTSDNIIITTACLASMLWKFSEKYKRIKAAETQDILSLTEKNKLISMKLNIMTDDDLKKYNNGNKKEKEKILDIYSVTLLELANYYKQKRDVFLKWIKENKHRCFLEIQYHNHPHQIEYNKILYGWSKKYDIPLIAGTDTHSSTDYLAQCRKVLQISKDSYYGEEDEFDLTWKTYDELVECFKNQNALDKSVFIEAINNTNKLSDMVEDFTLDKTFKYPTLYGDKVNEIWKSHILKKTKEKLEKGIINVLDLPKYKLAINDEFKAMTKQGMGSFMMFMSELMIWCRENSINSSPCRGSVGGSVIAYITDIIDVDPIRWNTVFSRFCNADRISLADIDADFSPSDRKKVYKYIISRFGLDKVSYILTLGTIQDKGSIDVLAKGLKYEDLNAVKDIKNKFIEIFEEYSKIIQEEVNLEELEGVESKSPNFGDHNVYINIIRNEDKLSKVIQLERDWTKLREDNKDLFYYFEGVKGTIIAKGTHAAGMIGSPITLNDNLGVFYKEGDEEFPVSFCSMKAVDSLNYVKFDILGLKTVGIIQDTYKYINKEWEYAHEINWDDKKVWDDMTSSNVGVFQFEGDYAIDLLCKFKPQAINDMSLVNASLRPSGKSYRDRLINHEFNNNPSEQIDELLVDNKGFLVFQEDTIKFLTDICGFSGSLADTTRRAIGKKDLDLLNEQLPKILEGYCNKSNKPREIAEKEAHEFIQIISDSSEYQFGYNHSTGYSMVGYMSARLRYYYPLEFTTAYLNRAENDLDIKNGTKLAREKGFDIKMPRFASSKGEYFFDKSKKIIYKGVGSIKGLSVHDGDELFELSKKKDYTDFIDLMMDIKKYTKVNQGKVLILIKLNYFEEFGSIEYLLEIKNLLDFLLNSKGDSFTKQLKKSKIEQYGFDLNFIKQYGKETDTQIGQLRTQDLLVDIISETPNKKTSIKTILDYQLNILDAVSETDNSFSPKIFYISDLEIMKSLTKVQLYCIKNGNMHELKMWTNQFNRNQFKKGDVLYITKQDIERKNKRKPNGEIDPNTGKKIYVDIEDSYEFWLKKYKNITYKFEEESYDGQI